MIRNNNPGNIRASKDKWQGMTGKDSRGFVIFNDLDHGYRALYKLLITYINTGSNTIRKAITRWAPPKENDTDSYIRFVSRKTNLDPDTIIKPSDLYLLGIAISLQEHSIADNESAKKGLLLATGDHGTIGKPSTHGNSIPLAIFILLGAGLVYLWNK